MINANRGGTINFYNTTISNGIDSSIDTFYAGWNDGTGDYTANFNTVNDYSNAFPAITGTRITTGNPLLDANLDPQSGSALIDPTNDLDPTTISVDSRVDAAVVADLYGNTRPYNTKYDLGAVEYGAGATPPIEANKIKGRAKIRLLRLMN